MTASLVADGATGSDLAPTPELHQNGEASSSSQVASQDHQGITEDEARLYDRQLRLWGLDAQNRMRSSTVLILGLRAASQEVAKNIALAGVGSIILMDDADVSEEDLGSGLLYREDEGCVGMKRVDAAAPQVRSLNPLVKVRTVSTRSPLVDAGANEETIAAFLREERVNLVCATDLAKEQLILINTACRKNGILFYGAGSYGFVGYVFADLGNSFDWLATVADNSSASSAQQTKLEKRRVDYVPLETACEANPFKNMTRSQTKMSNPEGFLAIQAESLRRSLEVNEKALKEMSRDTTDHLAEQYSTEFPPAAAILGGLLAQDILRALSRKESPILNFLVVDTMQGTGNALRWGVNEPIAGE